MKTAFIFHGTAGYPEENWFPWLKGKLEERGYQVFVPQFPTPEGQSVEAWKDVLSAYKNHIDEHTILIGHSLGGIFLLHLLPTLAHKIRGACFVGTPIGLKPMKNYEGDSSFGGFNFKWDAIREKSNHFIVFQSDDDPYVPHHKWGRISKAAWC
ncbi:MAG: alpha/beta fold hydrolase [Candidatus Uhrbacteria bacterium]|nr:alpha/beta fold hydrolase [Candidatus Uhrbacteria bacterium]